MDIRAVADICARWKIAALNPKLQFTKLEPNLPIWLIKRLDHIDCQPPRSYDIHSEKSFFHSSIYRTQDIPDIIIQLFCATFRDALKKNHLASSSIKLTIKIYYTLSSASITSPQKKIAQARANEAPFTK